MEALDTYHIRVCTVSTVPDEERGREAIATAPPSLRVWDSMANSIHAGRVFVDEIKE